MPPIQPAETDLAALERFVVDNDDLLQLEEMIGRFNIFDALGIARAEIRHSNFLAWLLDPAESHGQGDLFLKAVLVDLLRRAPVSDSAFDLDAIERCDLRNTQVRREWENIDILITCKNPPLIVAIENKVDSGEHSGQLRRYTESIQRAFGDRRSIFVFLSPDGTRPSDSRWFAYSYEYLCQAICGAIPRCRPTSDSAPTILIQHYVHLLGVHFMAKPDVLDVCRQLYNKHRVAVEVLAENLPILRGQLLEPLHDALAQDPYWAIQRYKANELHVQPSGWSTLLPAIGTDKLNGDRGWIRFWFAVNTGVVELSLGIGPTSDPELRNEIATILVGHAARLRWPRWNSSVSDNRWVRPFIARVAEWPKNRPPNAELLAEKGLTLLNEARPHLDDASREIRALLDKRERPA